jgi:hypothetical protein
MDPVVFIDVNRELLLVVGRLVNGVHTSTERPLISRVQVKNLEGVKAMNTMLIVIWTALGLCFVPIIFVSLGLWASAKIEDPREYQ